MLQIPQRTENNGNPMIVFLRAAFFSLVCLSSLAAGIAPSSAADYPSRPVRWLIGFAAGGAVDIVARIMSQWLSEHLGQQFIVENRAGSSGEVSDAATARLPPAPARLSTMTCRPKCSDSHWLMMRATISTAPPAAKPISQRTGRLG